MQKAPKPRLSPVGRSGRPLASGFCLTAVVSLGLAATAATVPARAELVFQQTNLVSDGFVGAQQTDPNLINPWGVSFLPGGPFWISDNNSGFSSVDGVSGGTVTVNVIPPVTIATPPGQMPGTATPDGQVVVGGDGFNVTGGGKTGGAAFLFATEDGTISGLSFGVSASQSFLEVDHSNHGLGAVYKGLAVGKAGAQTLLYAANFRAGTVEVYDTSFNLVDTIVDPKVPKGYAPFNVQVLNTPGGPKLFVTFALQDHSTNPTLDKHDDVAGIGHGFVDEFNLDGTGLQRIASHGVLDSPWGLDIAPASFGRFAGDLLVGNFGNGEVKVFSLKNHAFLGTLDGVNGKPFHAGDLWALTNGGSGLDGDSNTLFFTAGLKDEMHGLFGMLTPTIANIPEPASLSLLLTGLGILGWRHRRGSGRSRSR